MPSEILKILSSVIRQCSQEGPSLNGCIENALKFNFLGRGDLRYDFSGSQAAFYKHLGAREMINKGQLQVETI
jgi:hypothetical protein